MPRVGRRDGRERPGSVGLPPPAPPTIPDVPPTPLALVFLAVMGVAVVTFVRAYVHRKDRSRHVRLAVLGTCIDLFGTLAVVVTSRFLAWTVPAFLPGVASVHRVFAYVVTAFLLFQAVSGAMHLKAHRQAGLPFLVVYVTTYALAVVAYAPR